MATISLNANKINQMPALIKDVKQAVIDYKSELTALKTKTLTINRSVCNLDDVISSIQTSTQTQEQKIASLDTFSQNSENFIAEVVRIDSNVADIVKQRKDEFYGEYSFLKPDSEKSGWEKFKDGCKAVGEWCKAHWVMIVTVIVVILVAAIAVVCGVAIAFIAAVASIIALALCIADVICMLVTGGKGIADVLRENGYYVLADIFQGVSIGADIVSIVFPLGAAIKTMAKVGVKTFLKASFNSIKLAFKETIEKVFKSGFKNGIKNLGQILFKTLILDIDDLKNWKAVPIDMIGPTKNWIVDGDQLIPSSDIIPGKSNPDRLTMEGIMNKFGYDSIPFKNGSPDLSGFSVADVDISMKNLNIDIDEIFSGEISSKQLSDQLRNINFTNANSELLKNTGYTKLDFENILGYKLTWHEDLNMNKCWLVPTEIHANVGHTGGIGNYKFNFNNIADQINRALEKISQYGFRFALN